MIVSVRINNDAPSEKKKNVRKCSHEQFKWFHSNNYELLKELEAKKNQLLDNYVLTN